MLLKNSGWLSLVPGSLQCQSIDAITEASILSALQVEGRVHLALLEHPERQHYFVETDSGRCLFVKRTSFDERVAMRAAADVAKWLYEQGCCTPLLMDVIHFNIGGGNYQLWVYLYVQGRFCLPTHSDIHLLGASIASLHRCLKRNSLVIRWHQRTVKRYQQLANIREQVLSGAIRSDRINPDVYALLEQFDFNYFLQSGAMPLHGDLDPENFLITLDKNVCFFNFKRTGFSFERPIIELANVIQRLILVRIEDDRTALSLGKALLEGYRRAGGQYALDEHDRDCLFFLLSRAFAELLLAERDQVSVSESDWEQCLYLLDIAKSRNALFCKILLSASQH